MGEGYPPQLDRGGLCLDLRLGLLNLILMCLHQLGSHLSPQGHPKKANKLGVPAQNNGHRNSIQSHDRLDVQLSHIGDIICFVATDKVRHFRKAIHHYKDGVPVPLGLWKVYDKVHALIYAWKGRNWQYSVEPLGK